MKKVVNKLYSMRSNLYHVLCSSAITFNSRPLFHLTTSRLKTYDDFMCDVLYCQSFLQEKNVKSGDNVMIVGDNSPNWATILYASWGCGATVVPTFLKQQYSVKQHIINETKPKVIFNTGEMLRGHNEFNYIKDDIFSQGPLKDVDLDKNKLAAILYTSGTSGLPKGVPLTHENIISNIDSIDRMTISNEITKHDKYVSFLPWNHCYGLNCELNYIINKGASTHIVTDPALLVKKFKEHNPTILCAVPKVFQLIEKKTNFAYLPNFARNMLVRSLFGKNLRFCSVGGSAISPSLINYFRKAKIDIYQGYGSTECSPMISLNNKNENKIGSVGKILDCNQISFLNDEILVSGDNVINKYYNINDPSFIIRDDKTWYRTGDAGYLDEDGYLYVTGRIKEQYKLTNGKFINPNDVEQILLQIPEIEQAMVFGNGLEHNHAIVVSELCEYQIMNKIDKIKDQFKPHEIPKKIIVTKEHFSVDNNLLTQKQSLKRNEILKYYDLI